MMLRDHPSNLDPTAVLVTVGRQTTGRDVFRAAGGYVATMPGGMVIPGFFETQSQAQSAQKWALGWSEAIRARLAEVGVVDLSDADLENALGPCVCGPRLVAWAKALRDAGVLKMSGVEIELARPASGL